MRRMGDSVKGVFVENRLVQAVVARKWSILLLFMAFLLGRAMILDQLAPFGVAFFLPSCIFLRRELLVWTAVFIAGGSLFSVEPMHTGYLIAEMVVFLLLQKGVERFQRSDISYAPAMVFATTFFVRLFSHLASENLSWYTLMMTGVGALLSLILTHIFLQAVPVFTLTRKKLQFKKTRRLFV